MKCACDLIGYTLKNNGLKIAFAAMPLKNHSGVFKDPFRVWL